MSLIKDRELFSICRLVLGKTSGVYAGLSLILDAKLHEYNVTSSDTVGFKVSIQGPDDFARTEKIGFLVHSNMKFNHLNWQNEQWIIIPFSFCYFQVSPGNQVDAAVTGQQQISDPRLESIDRKQRQCAIRGEIKLKHFDTYTNPYCLLECLVEALKAQCGCVPFYYPGKNWLQLFKISQSQLLRSYWLFSVPLTIPSCSLSSYICVETVIGI